MIERMFSASIVIFPLLVVQNVFAHHMSAECELPRLIPGTEIASSSCCEIPESYLTLSKAHSEAVTTCMEEAKQQARQNRPGHRFGPGNRMQAPPGHRMGGPPGHRMEGPPGHRMEGPPGHRMGGPPGHRMEGPPGHRMPRPPVDHITDTESANFGGNRPPRMHMRPFFGPCLDECAFGKLGLLNEEGCLDHKVILEKGVKDLCDEWSDVGKAAVEHCLKTAPEHVPENGKCKSGAFEFRNCMEKQLFMNCPDSKQNASEECSKERSRLRQCENHGHSEESEESEEESEKVSLSVEKNAGISVGFANGSEKDVSTSANAQADGSYTASAEMSEEA